MVKKFLLLFFVIGIFFWGIQNLNVEATHKNEVDRFYSLLPVDEYKEYENATENIRDKMLYGDVNGVASEHLGKDYVNNKEIGLSNKISSNTEVFFLASIINDDRMEVKKYAVYDANSGNRLESGISKIAKKEAVREGKFNGWEKEISESELSKRYP